ncbi:MAG: LysE family translocator [Dinoroseobacter sp.]|nr:LysE family translocator [Dinoroseobacter sp.]MDJ0993390.1 LysE family translocator [Dinoroseobacter sp.]
MSFDAWLVFATFWVLFVTTPGPNAVNCIGNGMTYGFARALWGVAGILTQATLFLTLSAAGVTALITAAPEIFSWVKLFGAGLLIALGVRAWLRAGQPMDPAPVGAHTIYGRAFLIATINAKSLAGYLAAFSQFVQPDVPIWDQMWVIFPTALSLTALSYITYTALGAGLGKMALGAVLNVWVRRALAVCFVIYGVALASYQPR